MSKEIDDNGFWLIEDNPVSIEGVFPYLGKTIDPRLEPDRIYQVYRPFDELSNPETLKSFDGIPFIDDHEMLGEGFTPVDKRPAAGVMMNPKAGNGMLRADLKIFSEEMKDKIAGGKKELSLGYQCTYQLKRGVWNGKPYDAIQRDLRGNHIALVDRGRMGAEVRVYDRAVTTCDALDITQAITSPANKKEKEPMAEEEKDLKKEAAATDESVDKRKLIDDLGGFLKDKGLSNEDIRFAIGIAEKIGYNASEAGKATDEDETKKSDEEEKSDKEEKKAEDKCSKDEDAEKKSDPDEEEKKAEDGKCKDEFFDGPKLHKLLDDMEAKKEISSEAASKIKQSTRYSREGKNAADSLSEIIAAEVKKQLEAKAAATDSAIREKKADSKVYGLAEDSNPDNAPIGRSPWLNEFLNKKN